MLQFKPKMTQAELIAIKVIKSQLKIIDNRIDERTILQIFELSFSIGHENDHFSNLVQNMRKERRSLCSIDETSGLFTVKTWEVYINKCIDHTKSSQLFYELLTLFVLGKLDIPKETYANTKKELIKEKNFRLLMFFNMSLLGKRLMDSIKKDNHPDISTKISNQNYNLLIQHVLNFYLMYKKKQGVIDLPIDKSLPIFNLIIKSNEELAYSYQDDCEFIKNVTNQIKEIDLEEKQMKIEAIENMVAENLFSDIMALRYGIEASRLDKLLENIYSRNDCPHDLKLRLDNLLNIK